jgi:hypothetical protein
MRGTPRKSTLVMIGLALLVALLGLTARRPQAASNAAARNAAPAQGVQHAAPAPANTGFFTFKRPYVLTG